MGQINPLAGLPIYQWGDYLQFTRRFADASKFPPVGLPGSTYVDMLTGIDYFWDIQQNKYVARLMTESYDTRADFPLVGRPGTEYIDEKTLIKYFWDSTINDYTTDVTVALGTIFSFTDEVAPAGYFVMDGRAFDIAKYSLLHDWLTTNWENYSSGFIPDMQDLTVRGKTTARAIGNYQADAVQDHAHNASSQITSMHFSLSNTEVVGNTAGLYDGNGNKGHYDGDLGFVSAGINTQVQGMKSGNIASETRMKNKAVVFIIKATMRIPL